MLHALECLICSMFGLLGHGSMYISLCIEFLGLYLNSTQNSAHEWTSG
jgi:hypothetical protein